MRETNQCAIDEMFLKTIQVKMNEKTLENACLELVTISGCPLKLMDDSGFRQISNPLLEGMRAKITVNAENINEKIGERPIMFVVAQNWKWNVLRFFFDSIVIVTSQT